jgi:AcrR family transcriptional regulator
MAGAGRAAQRRRTRKAIVDATARLLEAGGEPSVAEIATAAEVSRRTVYLHFPTLEQLLLDATLGAMASAGAGFDADSHGPDVAARVRGLADTLQAMSARALPLGRRLIRLTVDSQDGHAPRRGYRRTQWIEEAVEPLRDRLTAEQLERLVSALSMVLGWEAMIVLRDVRGLAPRAELRVTRWAAQALLDAMLAEAATDDA